MKYRIASLILAVCFLMSAAVPAMASEVVDTKYNYTPLPGLYWFDVGSSNHSGGAVPVSGGGPQYTLTLTDTTNTHFNLKINADVAGQYDYVSFVVFCQTDNITTVAGYLENASGSIATECEYSVTSASDLIGQNGTYAVTVLVDCSGFTGDVNVEISGHLGAKSFNDFTIYITGYSVSSYSGVLVDYWDDTLELLRQILSELQEGNGLLSDIKTGLAGFRSDFSYWIGEVYSAIQLNFLTLFDRINGFKTSVESWFEETFSAIQLGFLSLQNALVGDHYTQDDDFSDDADSVVQENQEIVDQIQDNTPTIPIDDLDPAYLLEDWGVNFTLCGSVLSFFIADSLIIMVFTISLIFALLAYAFYGKR